MNGFPSPIASPVLPFWTQARLGIIYRNLRSGVAIVVFEDREYHRALLFPSSAQHQQLQLLNARVASLDIWMAISIYIKSRVTSVNV
jgi:hypothetical protein